MLTVNGNAAEEMVMGEVPMMTPCEQAEPPVHESVVVATCRSLKRQSSMRDCRQWE